LKFTRRFQASRFLRIYSTLGRATKKEAQKYPGRTRLGYSSARTTDRGTPTAGAISWNKNAL
jgi:hypothetical protein